MSTSLVGRLGFSALKLTWMKSSCQTLCVSTQAVQAQKANFFSNSGKPINNYESLCSTHKGSTWSNQIRNYNYYKARQIEPSKERRNLKYRVHFPEDGIYTVEHLPTSKLAGRDPNTGKIVHHNIGGGRKTWYRWIDKHRVGPTEEGKFLEEKVIAIERDPNRSAFLALVGCSNNIRYTIATTSMKVGDIIRTSSHIPLIPVRPKEGDAYPLGALPIGTQVCCLELFPKAGMAYKMAAGTTATITAKHGDKMVVSMKKRLVTALDPKCMAVVGQVSNPGQKDEHVGSPNRLRWLGVRPGLGLKQKKDGRYGRKIKPPRPMFVMDSKSPAPPTIMLTVPTFGANKKFVPGVNRRNRL